MSVRRFGLRAGLLALLLGPLAACSGDDTTAADPVPSLSGQVFDDPAGDVAKLSYKAQPPPGSVGDVRRAAVALEDGVVSITVALQDVAEPSAPDERATRYSVALRGTVVGGRSLSDELIIGGDVSDRGRARAGATIYNEAVEYTYGLCRGRAALSPSRALVRVEVPLTCLPRDRLRITSPELSVEVQRGPRGGEDVVDLGVRRLSAG